MAAADLFLEMRHTAVEPLWAAAPSLTPACNRWNMFLYCLLLNSIHSGPFGITQLRDTYNQGKDSSQHIVHCSLSTGLKTPCIMRACAASAPAGGVAESIAVCTTNSNMVQLQLRSKTLSAACEIVKRRRTASVERRSTRLKMDGTSIDFAEAMVRILTLWEAGV